MSFLIANPYTKEHLHCRKIECLRHCMVKPGGQPFVMERIPALKNIKESDAKIFGVKLFRRKKDLFGRPIVNWKDYYYPLIAASYAKEQIYNNTHPICRQCQRCQFK